MQWLMRHSFGYWGAGYRPAPRIDRRPGTLNHEDGVNASAQFQDRLNQVAKDTEALLDRLLGPALLDGEIGRPARLLEAMRYASLGAGKRFRPFLVVECASPFGVDRQRALMARDPFECIPCHSL